MRIVSGKARRNVCGVSLALVFIAAQFVAPRVYAQVAGVNVYARPGYPTMTIYVWNEAGSEIWTVEQDADFIELLTYMNITGTGTASGSTRQIVSMEVYREGPNGRREVYDNKLLPILRSDAPPPDLQDGDVLVFRTRDRFRPSWQSVTSLIGTASSIALLIFRIARF